MTAGANVATMSTAMVAIEHMAEHRADKSEDQAANETDGVE
jgi:hypothetical protein